MPIILLNQSLLRWLKMRPFLATELLQQFALSSVAAQDVSALFVLARVSHPSLAAGHHAPLAPVSYRRLQSVKIESPMKIKSLESLQLVLRL